MVCRGSTLLFRATGHGRHATGRWSIARKPTGQQPGLLVPAAPGSGLATQVRAYGRSSATVQPPRFAAQSPARNEALPPPLKAPVASPADAVPRASCQMRDQAPRDRRAGWAETPPGLAGPRQLPLPSHAHRPTVHLRIISDGCGPHATRLPVLCPNARCNSCTDCRRDPLACSLARWLHRSPVSLLRNTGLGDANARIASTARVFRDRGRTLRPDAPTARI